MGGRVESAPDRVARLWLRRDVALDEPPLTLDDLVPIDGALQAELASLRGVAHMREPGHVFAAAVVRFDNAVLRAAERSPEMFRGLESALGWMEADQVPLARLPERAVIAGCAVHRRDPGAVLERAIHAEDPLLRARALKAVWQLGRGDLVPAIRGSYADPDVKCRFSACWAGALLVGDVAAVAGLRRFAETGERYPDRAVQLACAIMAPAAAREWIGGLAFDLQCLGAASIGRGPDVAWLAERRAGEGVFTITGGGLDGAARWRPPEGRRFLGQPLERGWLLRVLRRGRMPHRHLAATELCLLSGEAPYEFRAPAFRQLGWLAGV